MKLALVTMTIQNIAVIYLVCQSLKNILTEISSYTVTTASSEPKTNLNAIVFRVKHFNAIVVRGNYI